MIHLVEEFPLCHLCTPCLHAIHNLQCHAVWLYHLCPSPQGACCRCSAWWSTRKAFWKERGEKSMLSLCWSREICCLTSWLRWPCWRWATHTALLHRPKVHSTNTHREQRAQVYSFLTYFTFVCVFRSDPGGQVEPGASVLCNRCSWCHSGWHAAGCSPLYHP